MQDRESIPKMTAIDTQTSPEASSLNMAKMSSSSSSSSPNSDLEFAKCECCGLTEECTEAYIKRVRERFQGRWICGLCAEAVKDEVVRSQRRTGDEEEALNSHMSFCKKFRSLRPPPNPTHDQLISAVKQLLLRSLDSPSPKKEALVRSRSCFSALDRWETPVLLYTSQLVLILDLKIIETRLLQ
mgnify:CR=1 FL=1